MGRHMTQMHGSTQTITRDGKEYTVYAYKRGWYNHAGLERSRRRAANKRAKLARKRNRV